MRLVFFTGAGISAESGIPTFRGMIDGLWENHNVEEVATHNAIVNNPEKVYKFINELRNKYKDCQPNEAHKLIAELEKDYDVTVITQNIDNLHEKAGSTKVIHLHGDLSKVRALDDDNLYFDYDQDITPDTVIDGHKVRPHVVLFGEDVPNMTKADDIAANADVFVVVGSSLTVYPAANLVEWVDSDADNPIYYIDPRPSHTPSYLYVKEIKEKATEGMRQLVEILKDKL